MPAHLLSVFLRLWLSRKVSVGDGELQTCIGLGNLTFSLEFWKAVPPPNPSQPSMDGMVVGAVAN